MNQDKLSQSILNLMPGVQDTLFICILYIVCARGSNLFNADGDLGRHITLGEYMLKNGIPFYDIFSYTMAGHYMVSHEWLAQIFFGTAHLLIGLRGDVLLTAILIATTFTLVFHEILRRGTHYILALFIISLAILTSIIHWLARPHIFTFLFVALWTINLQKIYENHSGKIWIFSVIMLIWANTHGAFIIGFVILAAYFAGWLWEYISGEADLVIGKKLILIGLTSFAVTFINPYGWHLWGTSVGYFGSQFLVDYTIEYQSPNFHEFSGLPFMLMLALGLFAPAIGRKPRIHEAFLLAGWSALGLYSKRNIPLFAIITAPYLAYMLQPVFEKISLSNLVDQTITKTEKLINRSSIVMPVLAIILIGIILKTGTIDSTGLDYQYDPQKFPVDAVNWLETHPQHGNMFNQFSWGGYILYRMWPQQKVFIDGQTDFYGEALTLDYVRVRDLRGNWQQILAKYNISWAIIGSDQINLSSALQKELNWKIIYQDKTSIILHHP